MEMLNIKIQVPNTNLKEMNKICERYDCYCKRIGRSEIYRVYSNDPMCFYWLGANIVEHLQIPTWS